MNHGEIIDYQGNSFVPVQRPTRVISLVPSITELLFDIGLNETEVVGRTRFCVHPSPRIKSLPSMGGTKDFSIDRVIEQHPEIIIVNVDENRREDIEALNAAYPQGKIFVTHPNSFNEALLMICDIGQLFMESKRARVICNELLDLRDKLRSVNRSSVLYLIWSKPYMSVTPETFISDMLEQAGYANIIDAEAKESEQAGPRYPDLSIEEIVRLNPTHIFLSSEPYPFKNQHVETLRNELAAIDPGVASNVSIRLVDGEHYSWYGSRMLIALRKWVSEQGR
jgi:iron complex transport system substrate-binding protein